MSSGCTGERTLVAAQLLTAATTSMQKGKTGKSGEEMNTTSPGARAKIRKRGQNLNKYFKASLPRRSYEKRGDVKLASHPVEEKAPRGTTEDLI